MIITWTMIIVLCVVFLIGLTIGIITRVGKEMPGWKLMVTEKGPSKYRDLVAIPLCAYGKNLDGVRATFILCETHSGKYEWRRVHVVEC